MNACVDSLILLFDTHNDALIIIVFMYKCFIRQFNLNTISRQDGEINRIQWGCYLSANGKWPSQHHYNRRNQCNEVDKMSYAPGPWFRWTRYNAPIVDMRWLYLMRRHRIPKNIISVYTIVLYHQKTTHEVDIAQSIYNYNIIVLLGADSPAIYI